MTLIYYERSNHLVTIRLNRPEKLNALSREMIDQLVALFSKLESDASLRAVILTGTGDRAFCAGTDVSELADKSEADAKLISKRGQQLADQIERFPVPVIAAVNGIAAGGGLELVLACHLRIASTSATFSLPEIKLGVIPGYGGTQRLSREVGPGRALEMLLTGKTISAEESFQFGLLNQLSGNELLLSDASRLAEQIAQLSPLSIRACLKAVTQGLELALTEGLALETELFSSLFATDDAREGLAAFLEKRPACFTGK
jgi:enoyl-CoA hydratase